MVCPLYNIIEYTNEFVFRDENNIYRSKSIVERDEEKLNYHFNASLTSVNIAKGIAKGKVLRKMKR